MTITELEHFKNYLKEKFSNFNDKSYLIYILILRKFEFNMDIIEKNRNLLISKISDKIKNINKSKIERKLEKLKQNNDIVCDSEWQICLFDIESNFKVREYFIYRVNDVPQISENHFDEKIIKFNKILHSNFFDFSYKKSNSNNKNLNNSLNKSYFINENSVNKDINEENISNNDYKMKSNIKNKNNSYSQIISNNTSSIFDNKSIKSTEVNSTGLYNNKNQINQNLLNFNNLSHNYTEFSDNNIFEYGKIKSRNFLKDNYHYNNFLLERRDHICIYRNKYRNNYTRCSISIYASSDDKSEDNYSTKNKDNLSSSVKCNHKLNKKLPLDEENSEMKRIEYRNKSIS